MNSIIKIIATVLVTVIKMASPKLVADLKAFAKDFRAKCAATPNPWDDVLAEALCGALGIE